MVYPEQEPTDEVVRSITGMTLAEIDTSWESWIMARFAAFPSASSVAEAYRARTSWARLCLAGVNW
jgi:hypothetical protein